MRRVVILDRDGVINYDSSHYIKSVSEWRPIPGSLEAIAKFIRRGWSPVILTNQSGVGRGLLSEATLRQIHAYLQAQLWELGARIETILYCPHHPDRGCNCRKPNIGLYEELARRHQVRLASCWAIGDSKTDFLAAQRAGCSFILVGDKNEHYREEERISLKQFDCLQQAADYLLDDWPTL